MPPDPPPPPRALAAVSQEWLNQHIHSLGSLHVSGDALMTAVTGNALQPQTFLNYLRGKYSKLYKLKADVTTE